MNSRGDNVSSISSLSRAISGLQASQYGLQATAHNMANVNTPGYVRQQVLMKDSTYIKIGSNGYSNLMVGMGTDVQALRQVRDMFLDGAFRNEVSRYGYYNSGADALDEIQTILGETEGESMEKILEKFWKSLNELSKHPDGKEARGTFVQSAVLFVNKANLIMEQLDEYQMNLNKQVTDKVDEINRLGEEISMLNDKIVKYEINGDNANDYRDARNNALDKLANIIDITYKEDKLGNVIVKAEGFDFVSVGNVNKIELEQAVPNSPLVSPIWKATGKRVFNLDTEISPEKENDRGSLKGILLSRGTRRANFKDTEDENNFNDNVKPSVIMRTQAKFDLFVHRLVTVVNDTIAPTTKDGPFGLDGSRDIEIFKRKHMDRYDGSGSYIDEVSTNPNSLYSAGNLEINPEVLNDYDKICITRVQGEVQNNDVVEEIKARWQDPFLNEYPGSDSKLNINEYYVSFVGDIGNVGKVTKTQMQNQQILIAQIDNQRSILMGVSSDEELGNMMKYQHAYNASARVVTVVDQMLEQVINRLGLVGR
ncbi:flagellar hook-associated protein FlgK [Vallitalea guaymasensis]|uniref:Flagellar hook-associated protein 1 n=1 Tax=Vallitalea guaymasensis TaxID=1185412 RepID=A0A8J8SBS5_9FIRM|nr:flagellar hook-associated protein FlgK [Vallitalea guaymasensis]QUH28987.1 flagellar hook-associated protein FlgK [Vallitalea guaymasensis]